MSVELVLPTKKVPASRVNPKRLVIYSKPKAGKTTAVAGLENALILDLEKGTEYVDALKVEIDRLSKIREVGTAILAANKPYKYLVVDTVTALEDMVKVLALKLYRQTPMGKNFGLKTDGTYDDTVNILSLSSGGGYMYLREAFFSVLDYIDTLADNIILLGHLSEKQIDIKGKEVTASDINLSGKIKSLICANADAIAFLYREDNKVYLNFNSTDTIICGARPEHLRNKQIVISEQTPDGKIKTNWDQVYIKEKK